MTKKICFSVEHICKTFSDGFTALNDVSLKIYEGETLIIAGSNGSGKTLLMRIITGLSTASSGEVFFYGVPIDKAIYKRTDWASNSQLNLRKNVGMVFQDADSQIICETVMEDVRFGPANLKLSKEQIDLAVHDALTNMSLLDKKDSTPASLSGGEKRRLAVAGIIAMGCNIIIMDEPFANLDYNGVRQTLQIIQKLQGSKKTIIILTHELEKVLAYANRLVILNKGQIVEDGNPQDIINNLKPEYSIRCPLKSYRSVKDCSWIAD